MSSNPYDGEKHSLIGHAGEDWGSDGMGAYHFGYNYSIAIT